MTGQLILGAVILALVLGLLLAPHGEGLPGEGTFQIVGQSAPDFSLRGLSGEWGLSQHVGKPMILAFWTTWCGICKTDLAILQDFYERYGSQVEVVAICPEHWREVPRIAAQHGITFPVLYDPGAEVTKRYELLEHLRYPFTVFVDESGRVTGAWAVGLRDLDHLRELLARARIPLTEYPYNGVPW